MGSWVPRVGARLMAFCPSCGSPASASASFCAKCGASLATPPSGPLGSAPAAPYLAPPPAAAPVVRPIGVTVVGIVTFVAAAFIAFGALVLFLGSHWIASFIPVSEARGLFTVLGPLLALFVLGIAALVAATGWGLLKGHNWAWVVMLVLLGLNALGGLGEVASQRFEGVLSILVSGLVAWYFFRPEVREWFGAQSARA